MSLINKTGRIEKLIELEDDASKRAFLIVIADINATSLASAALLAEVGLKLAMHIDNYEARVIADDALLNKGRGAWKFGAWALGVLQILLLAAAGLLRAEISTLHQFANFNKVTNIEQAGEIRLLSETLRLKKELQVDNSAK